MRNFTRRIFGAALCGFAAAHAAEASLDSLADEIFVRINLLRVREKVLALVGDEALAQAAKRESQDMARLNFFSHINPERGDLMARLREAGIRYWRSGENILRENRFDDPVSVAEVEWWYSLPHRENLVNPVYTHTGVGLARAADGEIFATQIFLTPVPPGTRRRA